ncbi:MAG: 5-deoxy-glucuronate isomerase [Beijerinckiaceae bacterium]
MAAIIRAADNGNRPLVDQGDATLSLTYFNLLKLKAGERHAFRLPAHESVIVPMSGVVDITVTGEAFDAVGGRRDVWSGTADSVYAPVDCDITLLARSDAEIAVAGGATEVATKAFRIAPDAVEMVDVGSPDTHSRRRIFHILGQNGNGRAGNLLVSELYADDGCWSGYPPHKHDEDRVGETDHEELYHYRFDPPTGFGAQICYRAGEEPQAFVTRDGDTFLLDKGYHPTVTSPGHRSYIFTILVGRTKRGLVQHFDPAHAAIVAKIPGIQAMRDMFK